MSSASVTRSITESKNAPRWLAEFDALAKAPSSRSGRAARTTSSSPARRAPCADGHRRGHTQQEPQDREVVGAQTGAAQAVSQRLDCSLDRCTEPSIEHVTQATRTAGHVTGPLAAASAAGTIARTTDRRGPPVRPATPTQMGVLDGEDVSDREHPQRGPRRTQREREDDAGRGAAGSGRGHPPRSVASRTARPSRTPNPRR